MDHPATRLLVSVRSAVEARAALEGGCDILDVKEPSRGSLGMADVPTIESVLKTAAAIAARPISVSAALGEAAEWLGHDVPALPAGLWVVKLGLAGLPPSDWEQRWRSVCARFEERHGRPLRWIAVAYADWRDAGAPPPEAIIAAASGCAGFLIDTFRKTGRTLLDCVDPLALAGLRAQAAQRGLAFAVAGSLRIDHLGRLAPVRPDIVAIRSAACERGQREGHVSARAVRDFRAALRAIEEHGTTVMAERGQAPRRHRSLGTGAESGEVPVPGVTPAAASVPFRPGPTAR